MTGHHTMRIDWVERDPNGDAHRKEILFYVEPDGTVTIQDTLAIDKAINMPRNVFDAMVAAIRRVRRKSSR